MAHTPETLACAFAVDIARAALVALLLVGPSPHAASGADGVALRPYRKDDVAAALSSGRLVLLRLGTTWCHWCHVMDRDTWASDDVARVVREGFVGFTADADAEPELRARFERWGWPATIVIAPSGEIALAVQGYRSPGDLIALLMPIVDAHRRGAPLPVVELTARRTASDDVELATLADQARAVLDGLYDLNNAGWGGPKKSVLAPPVLHALARAAREGDAEQRGRALDTLAATRALVDPVWGGVFQYSTHHRWDRPHTEKLAFAQADAIRMFVAGYRATKRADLLDVARGIHGYLRAFLRRDDGAFAANQDAGLFDASPPVDGPTYYRLDDAARRARGIPRVDATVFAEHNGALIAALAELAGVTGDAAVLDDARAAYARVRATHRDPAGRYVATPSRGGATPTLLDQVAMTEAALALLEVTGDGAYLDDARALVAVVRRDFPFLDGGYGLTPAPASGAADPLGGFAPSDGNARLGRALVRLATLDAVDDGAALRAEALRVARALVDPATLTHLGREAGELALLVDELVEPPLHLAVVGAATPARAALARAALSVDAGPRVVELELPGGRFPDLGAPVIFVCGESFCSRPLASEAELTQALPGFLRSAR